jgi:hypothetical protein
MTILIRLREQSRALGQALTELWTASKTAA